MKCIPCKGRYLLKNELTTDDLQMELMSAADLNQFIEDNEDKFSRENIAEALSSLFRQKDVSKAALAKNAGMNEVYLHQVFAGHRNPSRNRLLCLCFGLSATLEETQTMLKQCGYAQLYSRKKRDAVVIYGLLHGMSLFEVNDKLFCENEDTLY